MHAQDSRRLRLLSLVSCPERALAPNKLKISGNGAHTHFLVRILHQISFINPEELIFMTKMASADLRLGLGSARRRRPTTTLQQPEDKGCVRDV
jgi:hypothetical protein